MLSKWTNLYHELTYDLTKIEEEINFFICLWLHLSNFILFTQIDRKLRKNNHATLPKNFKNVIGNLHLPILDFPQTDFRQNGGL